MKKVEKKSKVEKDVSIEMTQWNWFALFTRNVPILL